MLYLIVCANFIECIKLLFDRGLV